MTALFRPEPDRENGAQGPGFRVDALIARRPRAAQIALLCDTRPVHRLMARYSGQHRPAGQPGQYRGAGQTVGVRLTLGRGGGRMHAETCPPDRVATEMRHLAARMRETLTHPPPGEAALQALGGMLATFFRIHPYVDGNGRVARILFYRAAVLLDLPLNGRWTLDRRGYGAGMWLAISSYPVSARPLETYLKRFFD